jgi:hypothetical protein
LTGAERTSLRAPRTNADSTFLPAGSSNAMSYLRPWTTIRGFSLQAKGPTDVVEWKTALPLGRPQWHVCKRLRPTDTRLRRTYEISILNKEGVLLRPIANIVAAPTHQLSTHLAGRLGPCLGRKTHCVRSHLGLDRKT